MTPSMSRCPSVGSPTSRSSRPAAWSARPASSGSWTIHRRSTSRTGSTAQLLWFRAGYVEYRFPNRVPPGARVQSLQLTAEICSEAPLHDLDWPSDITVWINGIAARGLDLPVRLRRPARTADAVVVGGEGLAVRRAQALARDGPREPRSTGSACRRWTSHRSGSPMASRSSCASASGRTRRTSAG